MTASEEENQEGLPVTFEMFRRVLRGKGTPEEEKAISRAMRDPNSELLDWLQEIEDWAARAFRRPSPHSQNADQILAEAIARKHRNDVLVFIHTKRAQSVLGDEATQSLLAAGALKESPDNPPSAQAIEKAANDMLDLLARLRPELESEARAFRQPSDTGPRGGHER